MKQKIKAVLKAGRETDIESMFQVFAKNQHHVILASHKTWVPAADVFETDEEFVIILDIAYIDTKNLEILVKKDSLVVRGVREEITKYNKRHYHKMEIDYGPFERSFLLPDAIDKQNIKSQYKDGFLEVKLKKVDDRRSRERHINIDWQE